MYCPLSRMLTTRVYNYLLLLLLCVLYYVKSILIVLCTPDVGQHIHGSQYVFAFDVPCPSRGILSCILLCTVMANKIIIIIIIIILSLINFLQLRVDDKLSPIKVFTCLLFPAHVRTHQVRILVSDNHYYPLSLKDLFKMPIDLH